MASLSLPRVLQLKKNSLDAEREHFEKFQTLAIQKAINSIETPVKEKHVRSTIIGTFQEQSAITYWMVAVRLPLQDNRIVAWKFCNVTHKLLREGHPACLDDSQRHIAMIENLGKLWVHLREGYGRLVSLYCSLLVSKLKFHARNPRFPGNMHLTSDELDAIAENDVNNYFQLCVELFDYMDDILNLQEAVFDSLGNARANSMTASGQCRLAALIPCAQDSSHIYDCNVRLLFRLHATLPPDTLTGHRERFRQQFKKLSSFYKHASSLQYYRNLLTLPILPSNPPNFLQQSDFGTYVAPVVSIPEPPPDEPDAVGSLIDTSETMSQMSIPDHMEQSFDTRTTPSPQPDPVVERDRLIEHLQNELKRMRSEISQMVQERNTMLVSMREHCSRLESQLQSTKTELDEEKQKAELLTSQTPEIKKKLTETEEKAKVTDEKFQKLKGAYTQLREEHITLIRQKAEVDKLSASLRAAAAQHESAKMALQQQLNDKEKDVEILQQSASSSEEIDAYKSEIANLRSELEQARQKEVELETLRASIESLEIEHKTATTEAEEKLNIVSSELKDVKESLEQISKENIERELELSRVKEELIGLREKSGEEFKKVIEEKEAALSQIASLTQQFQQEKQEQVNSNGDLQIELEKLQFKLTYVETQFKDEHEKQIADISERNKQFDQLLKEKDEEIFKALRKIEYMEKELDLSKEKYEEKIQENVKEITHLQDKIIKIMEDRCNDQKQTKDMEYEMKNITEKLRETQYLKDDLQKQYLEKEMLLSECTAKIKELEKRGKEYNEIQKITKKQEQNLETILKEKETENELLKKQILHHNKIEFDLQNECQLNTEQKKNLEKVLDETKLKIKALKADNNLSIEGYKHLLDEKVLDYESEISKLKIELQAATLSKDNYFNQLKVTIKEKDDNIESLQSELDTLRHEVMQLADDLNEKEAELEICQNELMTLRDEHESIENKNETNLAIKNQELRCLNEEINRLTLEKDKVLKEKESVTVEFALQKQVFETKSYVLTEEYDKIKQDLEYFTANKNETERNLEEELTKLAANYDLVVKEKDEEINNLRQETQVKETDFHNQLSQKDIIIKQEKYTIEKLQNNITELNNSRVSESKDLNKVIAELSDKTQETQLMEGRLSHIEKEKLTAECELQDLLQHNTTLEASLALVKKQLEEAQKEIERQRASIVSCVGDAAMEVTSSALASLERANARDSTSAAAESAVSALEQLCKLTEFKGNEEGVSRSAILAAHNAAQVSTYVTEVSNLSTDMELSDKLTSECRSMLAATQQCLESLKSGKLNGNASELSKRVRSVLQATSAADRANTGTRSVDDELADMDKAIEEAAGQIEEMLKASRAGDSGVKLEVNGKILDACTTLMGAVKILVQEARKLQRELGDPQTRQKMYRRNPQWSEGLISAAKAVVFAAKLLVTSADEAVGAEGRVEGVSAAAHEVAGSTAQLVAASRARAPPASPALARLTQASRDVAAATGAVVAAVRAGSVLVNEQEALDTSALTLTATRRLEMECKVRSLELECALDAERAKLAALRKRHYQLAQVEENGNMTNGKS